jgi:hypothetical protein
VVKALGLMTRNGMVGRWRIARRIAAKIHSNPPLAKALPIITARTVAFIADEIANCAPTDIKELLNSPVLHTKGGTA